MWWRITIPCQDSELASCLACELGAAGCELPSATECVVFYKGTDAELITFTAALAENGFTCSSSQEIENKNWVQQCADIFQPIEVGQITVYPLLTSEEQPARNAPNTIYVVPGNGFGTGHHESTRQALTLLQSNSVAAFPPTLALDVGTGNGVLALACAQRFWATVDAVDNDAESLVNARENLALNPGLAVRFYQTESAQDWRRAGLRLGQYDLITANIFAEVLAAFEGDFYTALRDQGMIILAGITQHALPVVRASFVPEKWQEWARLEENGWVALLLQKRLLLD